MSPQIKKQKSAVTVLFHFPKKNEDLKQYANKPLEDFRVIKPGIGEKILCVQRRHPIALLTSIGQQVLIVLAILILLFGIAIFSKNTFSITITEWIVITYIALSVITIFLISLIFIFMNWYYEFYIITNRSMLHRYCFRLAGPFSEIVYGEKMHVREIVRIPPNLIYDFLKIEDVQVYFQKQEQEEPFIFKTPSNAQDIEDLVHDLTIAQKHHRTLYD